MVPGACLTHVYSLRSSANILYSLFSWDAMLSIYTRNNKGPRTETLLTGTPLGDLGDTTANRSRSTYLIVYTHLHLSTQ